MGQLAYFWMNASVQWTAKTNNGCYKWNQNNIKIQHPLTYVSQSKAYSIIMRENKTKVYEIIIPYLT